MLLARKSRQRAQEVRARFVDLQGAFKRPGAARADSASALPNQVLRRLTPQQRAIYLQRARQMNAERMLQLVADMHTLRNQLRATKRQIRTRRKVQKH